MAEWAWSPETGVFLASLAGTLVLAHLLGRLFVLCSQTFTNRERLARSFVILAGTTLMVITAV